jgi:uncharacterized protein YaaW (UPF0174 family)
MTSDPIFRQLNPGQLLDICKILEWNPLVEVNGGSAVLTLLPSNQQFRWLDENRNKVEDEVRTTGSWTFGATKSYLGVVSGLAEKMNIPVIDGADASSIELSIIKKLWSEVEQKMTTAQREELHKRMEEEAQKHGKTFGGEFAMAGALGMAQLSGFGIYIVGSTLLGALNGALGLGLGFSAFTGLSSAISVVIGPVGWAALALFAVIRLGAPNYKKTLQIAILVGSARQAAAEERAARWRRFGRNLACFGIAIAFPALLFWFDHLRFT